MEIIQRKNAEDSSESSASGKLYTEQCECAATICANTPSEIVVFLVLNGVLHRINNLKCHILCIMQRPSHLRRSLWWSIPDSNR